MKIAIALLSIFLSCSSIMVMCYALVLMQTVNFDLSDPTTVLNIIVAFTAVSAATAQWIGILITMRGHSAGGC